MKMGEKKVGGRLWWMGPDKNIFYKCMTLPMNK